ncbi:hypothetical protein ACIRNI_23450 [Streptomyces sp. NPDC093546]|uniref:hypothetical protein n=1 Tax=Streptomyces sp. NPDC093546 TaxID=3366040 RepID=UPI00380A96B2
MSQPMNAPQPQQPQHGRPEKKRGWFARHKVLTGLGAVVVVVAVASAVGSGGDDASPKTASGDTKGKQEQQAKPQEEAKKAASIAGDGDHEVGKDVQPGLYRTSGNEDGLCYWERAKDSTGETDSILANDNVTGTSYVLLKASDKVFKSNGCKDWEAVDEKAAGTPKSEAKGDGGMFKVGADLAPGTYKSTGNEDDTCYWERAKDASHNTDAILANDNVSGTAIVKITATDGYFKTTGCKDWVKTG